MYINGVQIIDADESVTIGMDTPIEIGEHLPKGTIEITENGEHVVGGYAKANVNVEADPPPLQEKVVLPQPFETKFVDADDDFYGLSEVIVVPAKMQPGKTVFSSTSEQIVTADPPEVLLSFYEEAAVNLPYTKEFDFSSLEDGEAYIIDLYNAPTKRRYREIFIWESTLGVISIRLSLGGANTFFVSIHSNSISVTSTATTFRPYFEFYKFSDYNMGLDGVDIKPMVLDTLEVYPMSSGQMIGTKSEPIIPVITSETLIESDYTVQLDATLMPEDMVFIIRGTCGVPPGGEMSGVINQKSFVPDKYASSSEKVQRFHFTESGQTVTINFWTDSSHHTLTIAPNETAVKGLYIYKHINDGYNRVFVDPIETTDLYVTPTKSSQYFEPIGAPIVNIIEQSTVITTTYTVQLDATLMPQYTDCDILGNGDSGGELSAGLTGRFKVPRSTTTGQSELFWFDQTDQKVTIQFWTDSSHHTLTIEPGDKAIYELYIREHGYDGYSYVEVDPIPNEYIVPSGTSTITSNGIYDVTNYASASVNVSGGGGLTCTISGNGSSTTVYIKYNNQKYYTNGDTFVFQVGDEISFYCSQGGTNSIILNSETVATTSYTLTASGNIEVQITTSNGYSHVDITTSIIPSGTYNITSNGIFNVANYASASVNVAGGGGITADNIAMRTISGDISGNATSIETYAFYNCDNLTTASFPSATSIGSYAFWNCNNLTTVSFPNVTSIGTSAFYYCTSLTAASFPSVTNISSYAFASCKNLTTASFPNATSIGSYAFASCNNLTTVSFPNVTSIWGFAFNRCSHLTTASFPSATSIGSCAFSSCTSLTTISFPNVTIIGSYAFNNCGSLTTVSFQKATLISTGAFGFCSSLTTASFPEVTSIAAYAFSNCSSLTTIYFPKATIIGGSAFYSCHSLTTVSFPLATTIGNYAFNNCYNLLSVYLLGSSLCTNGGTSIFTNTPIAGYTTSTGGVYGSVFVPASLYDSYISATNWSVYSSRFVSLTDAEIEALLN